MAKIRKYIYIQEVILNNSYCQRLSERKNIRDHINKFFDIVDKLKNMNVDTNESLLSIIAIQLLSRILDVPLNRKMNYRNPMLKVKILEGYQARLQKAEK